MLPSLLAEITAPLALLPDWLSPEHIFIEYGLIAILIIIFAETGLLIGFFLPGDTLLFSAGILSYTQPDSDPLWMFLVFVPIAAILGNVVGYEIGRRAGPALFTRPDSKLFRRDHLDRSHVFFEKYGPITVFLARFVPIVRTFIAVVAGAVSMNLRVFVVWSVIGAVAWTSGIILLGHLTAYLLPKSAVDFIQGHIDLLIVGVVLLTIAGIAVEQYRHRRKPQSDAA
ncbi:DedA family protein [Patulibacter sp. S7RM1-6]